MSAIIALLSLTLMTLTSLLSDGSARYFEVSSKKGVAPYTVTFNSNDLKQAKLAEKFIWAFGDGETLTTTNASVAHAYLSAGTFTANLKYLKKSTDAISKAVDAGVVKIVISPKPNILPTPSLTCTPSPTSNILDCNASGSTDSDGVIASFNYEWGDGTNNLVSNSSNVSHTYSASGEKTVKLTVTDNKGDVAFVEKKFILKPNTAPVANFTCTKNGILKIHCESTSSDAEETLSNFQWTLDDGTTYTAASFDHSFNKRPTDVAVGSHLVTLVATDLQGLAGSISKNVDVTLEIPSVLPRGYFKVFMEDTTVNLHTFIYKTQFEIKRAYYTVYNATGALVQTIELSDFDYANTVTKVNLGAYGNYRIAMNVIDMRDQLYVTGRSFKLTENTSSLNPYVEFRAGQSAVRTVYMTLNPSFDFDEEYAIKEFFVDMGDGVQKHLVNETGLTYTYAVAGTYTLSVRAVTNHGTQTTLSRSVTITDNDVEILKPDPTFSYRIYDFAQNINFYDEKSSTANGEIISYLWDFGDGTTGTGQALAHFYSAGTYIVTLTVIDTAGMKSTQTQKVTILANGEDLAVTINCNFRAPYLDIEQLCKIVALDRLNDISRVRVSWGDGTSTVLTTPAIAEQGVYFAAKKFTAVGAYNIRAIVSTNRGVSKSWGSNVKLVARPPVASLNCYTNSLVVYCDALGSYDVKGTALTYKFDFGNGVVVTNSTGVISYSYLQAGFYNVSVNVTDATGLSSLATVQVNPIVPLPVASINCYPNNLAVYCDALGSYDLKGTALTYKFDFGNGFVESNLTGVISYAYPEAGLYNVSVQVTDGMGLSSSAAMQVQAVKAPNVLPVADFKCESNEPYTMYCWDNGIYDPDGTIAIKKFIFDDGTYDFLNPSDATRHQFSTSGEHEVILSVMDNDGGVTTITKKMMVKENNLPVASFECNTYGPQRMHCYSTSTDSDNGDWVSTFDWEFGDGTTQNGLAGWFDHTYEEEPIYTVKLTVHDQYGGSASIQKNITMIKNQAPVAQIECHPTSAQTYNCNADAHDPDGGIVEKYWMIDGTKISDWSAVYNFTNGGAYPVTFTMIDDLGKTGSQVITVNVDKPAVKFACSETSPMIYKCSTDNLVANEDDPIESILYIFDNSYLLPGNNVEYEFYSFGNHTVQIIVSTVSGLKSSYTQNIFIDKKYLAPRPEFIEDILLGKKAYFDASISEQVERIVTKYEWNFGDGEILTTLDPITTHQYNSYGWFNVQLKVTDNVGAVEESTTAIYVFNPEVEAPGDEGYATLAGIDSDNNGIRDDVQYWINKNSFESAVAKKAFRELASVYKNQLENAENITELRVLEDQKTAISACVDKEIVGEHDVTKSTEFELIYLNTNERMLSFAKVKGNLSGYIPNIVAGAETDVCSKWR